VRKTTSFTATVLFIVVSAAARLAAAEDPADRPWRPIPLVKDGKVSDEWTRVGWGRFVVDKDSGGVRTECDERGMGLLVYQRERLGDCQIRVVYKPETTRCNSGVYVRIADGILDRAGMVSVAFMREAGVTLSPFLIETLKAAADTEDGVWYAVHHG
jgi:hypothetical protein